jgi:hypothetical protein
VKDPSVVVSTTPAPWPSELALDKLRRKRGCPAPSAEPPLIMTGDVLRRSLDESTAVDPLDALVEQGGRQESP